MKPKELNLEEWIKETLEKMMNKKLEELNKKNIYRV